MSQNIISITFTDEEQTALTAAVEQIKQLLATKTIAMNADMRRQLLKMGVKSENFCRQAISGLDKNRQVVPPSLGLDEALLDLRALDIVRPVLLDLEQLVERLRDTETALGSDLMDTAVQGYSLLKHTGRNQGLDNLVKDLGVRFSRRAPSPTAAVEPEPSPAA
jgi:hypothetical protein